MEDEVLIHYLELCEKQGECSSPKYAGRPCGGLYCWDSKHNCSPNKYLNKQKEASVNQELHDQFTKAFNDKQKSINEMIKATIPKKEAKE